MPFGGGPMTEAMFYVLLALMRPGHGYQLMSGITAVSEGRMHMGPGTLYGVLSRLQSDGLIIICEEDGRRKVYRITQSGEVALKQEFRRLRAMVRDGAALEE